MLKTKIIVTKKTFVTFKTSKTKFFCRKKTFFAQAVKKLSDFLILVLKRETQKLEGGRGLGVSPPLTDAIEMFCEYPLRLGQRPRRNILVFITLGPGAKQKLAGFEPLISLSVVKSSTIMLHQLLAKKYA